MEGEKKRSVPFIASGCVAAVVVVFMKQKPYEALRMNGQSESRE